jgi:predicted hotdog family 3-hydroxylacyl-ACP dehydratase
VTISTIPPIAALLPHAPPMLLLDAVLAAGEAAVTAVVVIRPDSLFVVPGEGVPAHVGIEYMAQACGAYAGLEAWRLGLPVRVGFLLGTRRFQSCEPWLRIGWRLVVTARMVFREPPMGVFDCRIQRDLAEVATAQITVYQPEDPSSMLRGMA